MTSNSKYDNFQDLADEGDSVVVYYSAKSGVSSHYYDEFGLPSSGVLEGVVERIEQDYIDIRLVKNKPSYLVEVIGDELDGLV